MRHAFMYRQDVSQYLLETANDAHQTRLAAVGLGYEVLTPQGVRPRITTLDCASLAKGES